MKQSTITRVQKLESKAMVEDLKITIIQQIVARDEETGKMYIAYGHRKELWNDEPDEYLPREYFEGEEVAEIRRAVPKDDQQ